MLAVSFDPATQTIGTPVELFRTVHLTARLRSDGRVRRLARWDAMLMVVPVERPESQPNVVVLNWLDELWQRFRAHGRSTGELRTLGATHLSP